MKKHKKERERERGRIQKEKKEFETQNYKKREKRVWRKNIRFRIESTKERRITTWKTKSFMLLRHFLFFSRFEGNWRTESNIQTLLMLSSLNSSPPWLLTWPIYTSAKIMNMVLIEARGIPLWIQKDQNEITMKFWSQKYSQIWIHKDPGFERTHKFQLVRILGLQDSQILKDLKSEKAIK